MVKPVERETKKPYLAPVLTVHGTVQKLTQHTGVARNSDGGRFPRSKTHL
jgi:hypothetical protein